MFGYLEGKLPDKDIAIVEAYNYGEISGPKYVGGIAGKVGITESIVKIRTIYNRGTIKCKNDYNGGILGGAGNISGDSEKIVIENGFNLGANTYSRANQIAPMYATVGDVYYSSVATNSSGYGISYPLAKFKYKDGTLDLLYWKLKQTDINWAVDSDKNVVLSWEKEAWQFIN